MKVNHVSERPHARQRAHVSKTVTMLCVDFAARDPAHDCTAIATTVQFVAREA